MVFGKIYQENDYDESQKNQEYGFFGLHIVVEYH
jgi:hypothetical protein